MTPTGKARPRFASRFRARAQDAAIPIIIHEHGGTLYLNPKPDVAVGQGFDLYLVVVNLTTSSRTVKVVFEYPLEVPPLKTRGRQAQKWNRVDYTISVPAGKEKHKRIPVDPNLFKRRNVNPPINVIADGYVVSIGEVTMDPDVKIQR
jgi:hypothetical protein